MSPKIQMGDEGFREEVLNVILAELLEQRGLVSVPERMRRVRSRRKRRSPDITIVDFWGIRVIIEGRVTDGPSVERNLSNDAKRRIEEGLCPICIAVLYPNFLRYVEWVQLKETLANAKLRIRVFTEAEEGDWFEGTVDDLSEILRRTYQTLISEDVINRAVEKLDEAISVATEGFLEAKATPSRIRKILGIPEPTD